MSKISKELIAAYHETTYQVDFPFYQIKIGQKHPDLGEFLIDNNAYTWAFITAWNPYSASMTAKENDDLHQQLLLLLEGQSYVICKAQGIPSDDNWEAEKSVFILDISLEDAKKIGQQFQQNAFVFGSINQAAQLITLV